MDSTWIRFSNIKLVIEDKAILLEGQQLHDNHINFAQALIKAKFSTFAGLASTQVVRKPRFAVGCWVPNYVQILHCQVNHWVTASTIKCNNAEVTILILCFIPSTMKLKSTLQMIFSPTILTFKQPLMKKQVGNTVCGLYAIAYATYLVHGNDPEGLPSYQFDQMKF